MLAMIDNIVDLLLGRMLLIAGKDVPPLIGSTGQAGWSDPAGEHLLFPRGASLVLSSTCPPDFLFLVVANSKLMQ